MVGVSMEAFEEFRMAYFICHLSGCLDFMQEMRECNALCKSAAIDE